MDWIALINIKPWGFFHFFPCVNWNAVSFKRICLFHLNFEMFFIVIQESSLIFLGLQNSINDHFSSLILIIGAFFFFLHQSHLEFISLLLFVNNYLLVLFVFFIIYFSCFSNFCSYLYYYIPPFFNLLVTFLIYWGRLISSLFYQSFLFFEICTQSYKIVWRHCFSYMPQYNV